MHLAVPREITPGERRVALIPETVEKLTAGGVRVLVERGAGNGAFHDDASYERAGATIVPSARALYEQADLVVKIHRPLPADGSHEAAMLREGAALAALLQPMLQGELVAMLADRRITSFSMDAIPRISRAQALDVLSAMSTVAGYKAVLIAADSLPKFFPLLMTAAGTVTPCRMFVIGAGVAGLQAIATARRLGAVVEAFDTRPVVKEQVESLGARFAEAPALESAEGAGGYAKELSEEQHRKELEFLGQRAREADVVITTALIPGKRAPVLITADTVRAMRPGSVIVDLAGEFGGNCELSAPGETVVEHGVTIHAPLNLPTEMPVHASQMYSRNMASFLALIVRDGALQLDFDDQIVRESCITHQGKIVHDGARAAAGRPPA